MKSLRDGARRLFDRLANCLANRIPMGLHLLADALAMHHHFGADRRHDEPRLRSHDRWAHGRYSEHNEGNRRQRKSVRILTEHQAASTFSSTMRPSNRWIFRSAY